VAGVLLIGTLMNAAVAAPERADGTVRVVDLQHRIAATQSWAALVARASVEYGVPWPVLRAVMIVESAGDPGWRSESTGATGLMGIRPHVLTATGASPKAARDPAASIMLAARFLAETNRQFDNYDVAAAIYAGAVDVDGTVGDVPRDPTYVPRLRQALAAFGYIANPAPLGGDALAFGLQVIGAPYVWSAASPDVGFDCSGLVHWVYAQVGKELPRPTPDQWNATIRIDASQLQPGDLVFFGSNLYHVGIYAGGGWMLHAPREGQAVSLTRLDSPWWAANIAGYGRVP
jgi:hypothetical protein